MKIFFFVWVKPYDLVAAAGSDRGDDLRFSRVRLFDEIRVRKRLWNILKIARTHFEQKM
jgi:hypothetical protein